MLRDKNLIASVVFLLIGLFAAAEGYRLRPGTPTTPGAGFFPFYLGLILTVLAFVLLIKWLKGGSGWKGDLMTIGTRWKRLLFALGVFVVYVYALKPIGFLICSLILMILLLRVVEGRSWKSTLMISVICTVVSYVVFAKYLGVPLPRGLIPY